jgi:hypothetical protein
MEVNVFPPTGSSAVSIGQCCWHHQVNNAGKQLDCFRWNQRQSRAGQNIGNKEETIIITLKNMFAEGLKLP